MTKDQFEYCFSKFKRVCKMQKLPIPNRRDFKTALPFIVSTFDQPTTALTTEAIKNYILLMSTEL